MVGVVFVGGGGHASVCLDVFRSAGREVVGYLAPGPSDDLGLTYLGDDAVLASYAGSDTSVFIAVGSNARRLSLLDWVRSSGCRLASAVSASAVVSPSAAIGDGSVVMPGVVINARARVGDGVIVNTGATIDHDCVLHDGVHVAPGCHLAGGVVVGHGAFLGVGVSVIPERTIGEWTVVGAGAAVVRDLPDHVTAVGVPARVR
jgi:sugar O-acyltransferase (sialic acid O-acetyltransferase NeuD family)